MSHQLQDHFTCECFLLLALLAPLWELRDDGTEGWPEEKGTCKSGAYLSDLHAV